MNLLLALMKTIILLDLINSVWLLPAPTNVSMQSVDTRHVLKWWRPPQVECETALLYSVQFQGEFELEVLNNTWVDSHKCQRTVNTDCDLTFDLGSDSDYNVRVRVECGPKKSTWTQLTTLFNRRDTPPVAPKMSVRAVGDSLHVSFDKLPPNAVVVVTVWKKGDELKHSVYTMPSEQIELFVAALQDKEVYCVRAHIITQAKLQSSNTDTQCVPITGPDADAVWKKPIVVTVSVTIAAVSLFVVFWSMLHCRPRLDSCQEYFHKEPLPHSLQTDWDIQIPINNIEEDEELCEQIQVVQKSLGPAQTS